MKVHNEHSIAQRTGMFPREVVQKWPNGFQHLMGFLKNYLSSEDKQELLGLIKDYRQGLVPLIVPLMLVKHHLYRYPLPD